MLTKEKAMYQTWLIIQGLPSSEKNLISGELIDEIKSTMEVDENIKIDFSIPLEKQKLDSKTWKMLDKVLKSAEKNGYKKSSGKQENRNHASDSVVSTNGDEVEKIKLENIALNKEIQRIQDESKDLVTKYKEAYEKALEENKKIKNDCSILIENLKSIPSFIRKIFIKDEKIKLLISGK